MKDLLIKWIDYQFTEHPGFHLTLAIMFFVSLMLEILMLAFGNHSLFFNPFVTVIGMVIGYHIYLISTLYSHD